MSLTTLDLDDDALEAAMRLSGLKTKKDVVNHALREFADRHERIAALERYAEIGAGWDYDHWEREHKAEKDPGAAA
jgi:Arc/MetJ family transcription regulator